MTPPSPSWDACPEVLRQPLAQPCRNLLPPSLCAIWTRIWCVTANSNAAFALAVATVYRRLNAFRILSIASEARRTYTLPRCTAVRVQQWCPRGESCVQVTSSRSCKKHRSTSTASRRLRVCQSTYVNLEYKNSTCGFNRASSVCHYHQWTSDSLSKPRRHAVSEPQAAQSADLSMTRLAQLERTTLTPPHSQYGILHH